MRFKSSSCGMLALLTGEGFVGGAAIGDVAWVEGAAIGELEVGNLEDWSLFL